MCINTHFLWPENRFSALFLTRIPENHQLNSWFIFVVGRESPSKSFGLCRIQHHPETLPKLYFFDDLNFCFSGRFYFHSIILSPEQTDFKSDKTNYHLIAFGRIKHFGKLLVTLTRVSGYGSLKVSKWRKGMIQNEDDHSRSVRTITIKWKLLL